MKNLTLLICSMVFFVALSANSNAKSSMYRTATKDSVQIWTSPELFEIAKLWANTFEQNYPETKIGVTTVPADKVIFMIRNSENLGLVTKDDINTVTAWQMTVGKDILVPIMNAKNPFADQILKRGISPDEFVSIYNGETKSWDKILKSDNSNMINFYHCNSELNKNQLSEFLNTNIQDLEKTNIKTIDELIEKIQGDKYSIGFCKLADIIDIENHQIKEGLSFIPIDKNDNQQIDFAENIYNNLNDLERGVWIGKYPKELFTKLYTVASKQPTNNNEVEFINWIITKGQEQLLESGYSGIISSELHANIQSLYDYPVSIEEPNKSKQSYALIILIALVAAIFLIPFIVLTYHKSSKPISLTERRSNTGFLTESSVIAPNGLFFDKSHTWAFMEKDGNIRIGVSDFLQHITGKITKVDLKKPGETVNKGEPFMILIQEGKQLTIPSPITGKIKESNIELSSDSSHINSAPYSEGWVYLIESDNWLNEIKSYFIGKSYRVWLSEELDKLKTFFSSIIKINVNNNFEMVLQDGGELSDYPLENMSPIVWEEFQTKFINRKKS